MINEKFHHLNNLNDLVRDCEKYAAQSVNWWPPGNDEAESSERISRGVRISVLRSVRKFVCKVYFLLYDSNKK